MTARVGATVNASPLILLGKLDHLDLLPEPTFTTPQALAEVQAGDPLDHPEIDLVQSLVEAGSLQVSAVPASQLPQATGLHEGEASALALARTQGLAEVIVDDAVAIRTAKVLGLRPVSTPFLLLQACRDGRISAARFERSLERLTGLRYFLSPALYQRLLGAGTDA